MMMVVVVVVMIVQPKRNKKTKISKAWERWMEEGRREVLTTAWVVDVDWWKKVEL